MSRRIARHDADTIIRLDFFSCPAIGGRLESAAAVPWEQAPQCLSQARELMVLQARAYCESEDCSLDKLDTLAWIKSGVGKVCQRRLNRVPVIVLIASLPTFGRGPRFMHEMGL